MREIESFSLKIGCFSRLSDKNKYAEKKETKCLENSGICLDALCLSCCCLDTQKSAQVFGKMLSNGIILIQNMSNQLVQEGFARLSGIILGILQILQQY